MGEKGFSHNKSSADRKFMGSSPPNKRNERYNGNNDRINDNIKNNGRSKFIYIYIFILTN
jgi:hypothetical protein